MKHEDKIAKEIGDKLRGFREEPPAGMFERIEQTLLANGVVKGADAQPTPAQNDKSKTIPLWGRRWWGVAATAMVAASLLLVLTIGLRRSAPEEIKVATSLPEVVVPEVQLLQDKVAPVEPKKEQAVLAATMAPRVAKPVVARVAVEDMIPTDKEPAMQSDVIAEAQESVASEAQENPQKKRISSSRTARKRSSSRKSDAELEEYWRSVLSEKPRKRGLAHPTEVALYAANLGFEQGHIQHNNIVNSPMLITEENQLSAGSHYMAPSLVPQQAKSTLEHFMPVTVGVTVSYLVDDWLSVDSGLLYTNLYSTSDASSGMSDYGRRRTIDYLGVPLAMSVYFADFSRVSLYGRLGGTMELCINAKDKYYFDGVLDEKRSLDVPAITFSLDAAVGATCALWGGFGLFGEVGCSYWMAPKDYPENYRTVHPLSLASRVGLRFTFN